MSEKNQPEISKEMLERYFKNKILRQQADFECNVLSKAIKREMERVGRKEISLHGYTIDIETKYEPNEDFYILAENENLGYLISKSISSAHFKKALRLLGVSEKDIKKYVREKSTKWLHVDKEENLRYVR